MNRDLQGSDSPSRRTPPSTPSIAWATLKLLRHARRSVRGKLVGVVLLTTVAVLIVSSIAILAHDLLVYRSNWASNVASEANILAVSSAPALAFDDPKIAARNLAALQERKSVLAAALFTPDGRLYASWLRPGEQQAPLQGVSLAEGVKIQGENAEIAQRISSNGEFVGTIYLRARFDLMSRVRAYLGIFAFITVLSLPLALLLSASLQRTVIVPLEDIAEVAQQIVHRRDYSLRVAKTTDDEIGIVVQALNNMLDEVQTRALALEQSNASLLEEVADRQTAEAALARANTRLESTMAAAEIGGWMLDLKSGEMIADRNFAALYGVNDASKLSGDPGLSRRQIHADDLAALDRAQTAALSTGTLLSTEFRIIRPDGTLRWVIARGKVQFDANAAPALLAGLLIDVTAQKLAEEALREADRRKDEFLATLAHELRNPLAPIRNATHLLGLAATSEQQRQWGREVIARQVRHMALLLDDLLDVSRISRGRLDLKKEYVDLGGLVESAVEMARPLIDAKRHHLQVILPQEAVELNVDPLRISQALCNLLTNAAKYTDADGQILVAVEATAEGLSISVIDNGIGLADSAISRVFEMFSQVESALERSQGGLGIGLALARGLVMLHGGSLEAASEGPGRGSTFVLRLPPSSIVQRALSGTAQAARSESPPGSNCKVLIADDNRDAADSLAMLLGFNGYEVLLAYTGREALELATQERPPAMILDIGMPELSGHEVARRIREEAWGRAAMLVALTGWGQQEDIDRAYSSGFDHHFCKPVDVDELLSRLADFCAQRQSAG